ncbi:DUF2637 domain-containing protein [Salinispora vitiensis]|uniref:DUF2637 domain-containing protein n=1 Tax=Salinispora vitiensis TaxID=999544 RepID=UPI000362C1C9|nr:DUF2637 domain-containing protein [Salinispora vitiensis]
MPTDSTTFTEQFAAEYARNAVPTMLKAIGVIKRYNRFVLLGALLTSYLHQAHYLWTQNAGYFAYLVPLIFDAAMVSMLTVVRTAGIARDAKRGAMVVFAGAALLSATINFASPGSLALRAVFALVVVLVIGVELVAGRIRPDFAAIEAEASALLTAARDLAAKNHHNTPPAELADNPGQLVNEPPAPATTPTPRPAAPPTINPQPATPPTPEAVSVPDHMLPMARFAAVQHEQATGNPITPAELADRLDVTPATAGGLLAALNPTPINGHHVLTGDAR